MTKGKHLKHKLLFLLQFYVEQEQDLNITCHFLRQGHSEQREKQCPVGTSEVKMETVLGVLESQNQHLENSTKDTEAKIFYR